MGAEETLLEVAVDLAGRLASAEAQAWANLSPEHAWEHQAAEALMALNDTIREVLDGDDGEDQGAVQARDRPLLRVRR